jgi:hypothetical protein
LVETLRILPPKYLATSAGATVSWSPWAMKNGGASALT